MMSTGAHPRSRGENTVAALIGALTPGSSPLTRGKRTGPEACHHQARLIPAHAGKTTSHGAWGRRGWAHPRSRGENRNTSEAEGVLERLIPAHAGKTDDCAGAGHLLGAHPRSRGENRNDSVRALGVAGSSPLTRGKRIGSDDLQAVLGLIPAHAGKTELTVLVYDDQRAHPRSRGENDAGGPHLGGLARLIPAHAGKTITQASLKTDEAGSSPLTRGKRVAPEQQVARDGLIPAHAGKTEGGAS